MKEIRKGKFSVRQSKLTVGWTAFGYILEKHTGQTSQRFGALRKEDLMDIKDLMSEFLREIP